MDFLYVVLPALLVILALLWLWFVARRFRSLRVSRRSRSGKFIERLGLSLVGVFLVLVAASSAINAVLLHRARAAMPGQLYLVDGHHMRLDCTGSGSPVLVLDSGLGNDGLVWSGVTSILAQTTRVCSYDRAGMGWSDMVPPPRDADHIADQLHGLLAAAGVHGPIVLMGHSIAGLYIRDYAARYPAQIAGLIFVDSSSPFQNRDPAFRSEMQSMPSPVRVALMQSTFVLGLPRWSGQCSNGFPMLDHTIAVLASESRCHLLVASPLGEARSFDASSSQTATTTFGALPILVFSSDPARTLADHQPPAIVEAWTHMQEKLAGLSTRSRRIIAKGSPHYIMLERPELIVEEVPLFVAQVRGSSQPYPWGTTSTE